MDGQASGARRQPRFRVLTAFARKAGYPFAQVARRADLEAITRLGCLSFGASAFGFDKFRALHRVNPNILWVVKSSEGVIEGYLDIIPLKAGFAQELIAGKKRESDLEPSNLLNEA